MIDSVVPGLVFVRLRRIGLEVRGKCHDRVEALYCESIASAQSTEARNFYAGRYARFAAKVGCSLLPWSNLIPRLLCWEICKVCSQGGL